LKINCVLQFGVFLDLRLYWSILYWSRFDTYKVSRMIYPQRNRFDILYLHGVNIDLPKRAFQVLDLI